MSALSRLHNQKYFTWHKNILHGIKNILHGIKNIFHGIKNDL
jgi:hypothetical protein